MTTSLRIPNFQDPELTKFFTAWVKDQENQNKSFLSNTGANYSVMLQSPDNSVYSVSVDNNGNVNVSTVVRTTTGLGLMATESPDRAAFAGGAPGTGVFAVVEAPDRFSSGAPYVTSIAGNVGDFTLNSASGLTNTANDIKLQQASASQFGAVKVDGTSIVATAGVISTNLTRLTASLGADVNLNNIANYFDGPSVAQGTTGTWWASGTVTVTDAGGQVRFNAKLWDGTTVIASAQTINSSAFPITVSLSGYISNPAGNIRISVQDTVLTTGKILFNQSGNSKDSTISVIRIA